MTNECDKKVCKWHAHYTKGSENTENTVCIQYKELLLPLSINLVKVNNELDQV